MAFGIYLIPQFLCCRDGLVCIFVDIQQNQLNNWFVILNQDIKSRIPILGARSRSSAKKAGLTSEGESGSSGVGG